MRAAASVLKGKTGGSVRQADRDPSQPEDLSGRRYAQTGRLLALAEKPAP